MSRRTRFLDATIKGDLAPAEKQGGRVKPGARAPLPPDGDTNVVRDPLERKAGYAHVQKARVALAGALFGATQSLRALIEAPVSIHEAIGGLTPDDLPMLTLDDSPALAVAKQAEAIVEAARHCLPDTKVMEQRRRAIGMLFTLALKAIPRSTTTERKPRRHGRAAAQGLGSRSGSGKPEQTLRRVR